jgi:RimJ/RimL family protein N-acetyltransferase
MANVYLKPFTTVDIHPAYLAWLNDNDVNQYSQRRGRTSTREDAQRFLSGLSANDRVLGIHLTSDGRHIGNIQYTIINEPSRVAEIRIMIGDKSVWGKGHGSEAIYVLTKFLFEKHNMRRLEANTFNPAFVKCMEKLGWTQEGRQRERFQFDGRYLDFIWFGLLNTEFKPIAKFE